MLVLGCVNDPDYRSFAVVLKHVALWFYYTYIVLNCHQQTVSLFTIGTIGTLKDVFELFARKLGEVSTSFVGGAGLPNYIVHRLNDPI